MASMALRMRKVLAVHRSLVLSASYPCSFGRVMLQLNALGCRNDGE